MTTSALHSQPHPELWFSGSVPAAFDEAAAKQKLVFIYWGAVWCPPCNELKANVFSHPQFPKLMQGFVPLYLDGDGEEAQSWGDRLEISGYPTLLVLDAQRQELFRLSASVSFAEFADTIQALVGQSQTFAGATQRAEQGQATAQDWSLLAYSDWEQLPKAAWPTARRLAVLQRCWQSIPAPLVSERALLAAQWLTLVASGWDESAVKQQKTTLVSQAPQALQAVFADPEAVLAARQFINNQVDTTMAWLYPKATGSDYQQLKATWLRAATQIEQQEHRVSIDLQLWSVYPAIAFYQLEHPHQAIPSSLKQHVQAAVQRANQRATDAFSRHAVISGAASLLRLVGDPDGARALLSTEVKNTNTPWYYYSSLASLEQEQKRPAEAKKWAQLARQSAEGRATKLQWIASDIALNARLKGPEQNDYLLAVSEEFYTLATTLNDGFLGRNARRAEAVGSALRPLRHDPAFVALFSDQEKRCSQLSGDNQKNCSEHFHQLR